jgi:hypothetical protein
MKNKVNLSIMITSKTSNIFVMKSKTKHTSTNYEKQALQAFCLHCFIIGLLSP